MNETLGDTMYNMTTIEGKNHLYFAYANDEEFVNIVLDQLTETNAITGAAIAMTSFILSAFLLA